MADEPILCAVTFCACGVAAALPDTEVTAMGTSASAVTAAIEAASFLDMG